MRYGNGATTGAQLPVSVPLTSSDGAGTDSAPFLPSVLQPLQPPPTTPRAAPTNWGGSINSVAVGPQSAPTSGAAFGHFLREVREGPAFLRHVGMRGCGFPVVSVLVLGLAGWALGKAAQASPPALGAYAGALAGYLFRPLD